ncbi:hypothetical protein HK107_06400 [Parvularcula sp. ZS-1/3]|uniref:YbjN domain-containing protein n=1 Tax=Parvularcula mediterranea TaxID=2732508 RepID=A0A7Y3W560_9PROT|nr:YbjN domain-containing protein [Parvularcula mediterranea]NNU15952.1 hypothetical protein [Parvularcula mediterranea]
MMRHLILAVAAMFVGLGSAAAQSNALGTSGKIRNPSQTLPSLHAEALIPVLKQMGLGYEGATLPGGEKAILVQTAEGVRFQITPMACDRSNRCRGMHLVTMFETEVDRRTVAAFNDRYAFISAGLSSDRLAYLARYEIADFGMPRGNVAVSIEVFLETAGLFAEHLQKAQPGLKKEPHGSDLSANGLNMSGLMRSVSTGFAPRVAMPHSHALSFEETTDIVETFVRAEKLYPGRIVNELDPLKK